MLDKFGMSCRLAQLTATHNFLFVTTYSTQPLTTGINNRNAVEYWTLSIMRSYFLCINHQEGGYILKCNTSAIS